jgi:hypothetical protein
MHVVSFQIIRAAEIDSIGNGEAEFSILQFLLIECKEGIIGFTFGS